MNRMQRYVIAFTFATAIYNFILFFSHDYKYYHKKIFLPQIPKYWGRKIV
jgi:hypothetical protein